jgi:integrase
MWRVSLFLFLFEIPSAAARTSVSYRNPARTRAPGNASSRGATRHMMTYLRNTSVRARVAIVLLAQTGGRTYTEGFSLRWDQIDLDHNVIFFGGKTKTEGSSEPVPLTGLAHDVLLSWKKEQEGSRPFLFPSPVKPDQPSTTVKTAWQTTLKTRE